MQQDGQRDAANLLNGLRIAAETLFDKLDRSLPSQPARTTVNALSARSTLSSNTALAPQQLLRELLLVLELRWKLEEQMLFPALRSAYGCNRSVFDHEQGELQPLRDMAQQLHASAGNGPLCRTGPLAALEGLATLHFDDVAHLLARTRDNRQLDRRALGHEMQQLLARWRNEVRYTGDIENEDTDPVGQWPR